MKQTDFNGEESLSDVKAVYFNEAGEIKVYPNPVGEMITVDFGGDVIPQVTLYNALGEKMALNIRQQNSKLLIDSSVLAGGIYVLKVDFGNRTESVKLIK